MSLTRARHVEGAISNYEALESYARSADYTGVVSPFDGVFYPDICADVPEWVQEEVLKLCSRVARHPLKYNSIFFRLSTEGTKAPHQAHEDTVMGDFGFILYIGDAPEGSGTSLVRHKETGMDRGPVSMENQRIWQRDMNTTDAWEVTKFVGWRPNRALILPANLMHRAEPVTGFGKDVTDGRLVLIAFLAKEE